MSNEVTLVDPDPAWPERFEELATEIISATGLPASSIHHVGSTSIPGCAAKDRIDVLVEVDAGAASGAVMSGIVAPLEALGFQYLPEFALFMPERWFLQRADPFAANVHVERTGLAAAVRDTRLVFRDALRKDDTLRDRYVQLKRDLARRHPDDIDAYGIAKSDFVFEVLASAASRGDHAGVHLRAESPDSANATVVYSDYVAHLAATVASGYDSATDAPPPPGAYEPPMGTFLVMYDDAEPIGCGAVWEMEPGVAEVKRMWVNPSHHGRGLGRRMLEALEVAARALGCATARLDSMETLAAAVAMYRSQGYEEIPSYNDNPNATIWMQRSLLDN